MTDESKAAPGELARLEQAAQPRPTAAGTEPGRADSQPRPAAHRNFGSTPAALGRTSSATPVNSKKGRTVRSPWSST
jgi:hypothetical protein